MGDVQQRLKDAEGLIQDLDKHLDPVAHRKVQEVVGLLLDVHAEGLERLLGRLDGAVLQELCRDDAVNGLLLLHGLHPLDLEARVRAALESVKPYLASHGGNVELAGIDDRGGIRIRLEGSCHGCPSSAATLKSTIEQAIHAAAPDAGEITVVGSGTPVEVPAR